MGSTKADTRNKHMAPYMRRALAGFWDADLLQGLREGVLTLQEHSCKTNCCAKARAALSRTYC